MPLNLDVIRQQFPSLHRPAVFFDNPGGTQIARQSLDRINKYLLENNANHEGAFETSRKSDEDAVHVMARSREVWEADWHGTGAHIVDANRSKEEVLAEIKALVCSEL